MAGGTFQVVGALELGKQLEQLTDKLRKGVIKRASKKAMHPTYAAALQKVSRDTGVLAGALTLNTTLNKETGTVITNVGIKPGKMKNSNKKSSAENYPEVYGLWVEYGHYVGKRNKAVERAISRLRYKGRGRGGMALATILNSSLLRSQLGDKRQFVVANPFLRPSWDANKARAEATMLSEMQSGIRRETEKIAKVVGTRK